MAAPEQEFDGAEAAYVTKAERAAVAEGKLDAGVVVAAPPEGRRLDEQRKKDEAR